MVSFIKKSGVFFFLSVLISTVCYADTLTGVTGIINGTAPVINNANKEPGKINISKRSQYDAAHQLDVGDEVQLAWLLVDSEEDIDATLPSTVWTCDHPEKGSRVIATGTQNYTIKAEDMGCNIGVSLQPKTSTGTPRENTLLNISKIGAYDDSDNIIDAPVNPHTLKITDYIVAPGTDQSRTVPASTMLRTGWDGAKVQLETDNPAADVEWKSSDENIASVSSTGLVTFKSKGDVVFTADNSVYSTTIRFNPDLFFIFATWNMNWYDAKTWCEGQGYSMPSIHQLSTQGSRTIPTDSLWQEWGDVAKQGAKHSGVVFWSADVSSDDHYKYIYINDGHVSSNFRDVYEGVACVVQ